MILNSAFSQLQRFVTRHDLDGLWLLDNASRYWATNFQSSAGYVFVTAHKLILFLDGRYMTAATNQLSKKSCLEVRLLSNNVFQSIIREFKPQRVGIDGGLNSFHQVQKFKKIFPKVIDVDTTCLRQVKSKSEINLMEKTIQLAEQGLQTVRSQFKLGMSETQVRTLFVTAILQLGADGESFPTIVASGIRGALPHANASEKKIQPDQLVTIDFGCQLHGYASDSTRTFRIGQPSAPLIKIFQIVAQAQKLGIQAVKPGVTVGQIDAICRSYISQAGYGQFFTHSTGHGIGIEVHEPPYVRAGGDVKLKPGMIITIEPGIYVPELGGVRIEDQVLVTKTGFRLLTTFPRYDDQLLPLPLTDNRDFKIPKV